MIEVGALPLMRDEAAHEWGTGRVERVGLPGLKIETWGTQNSHPNRKMRGQDGAHRIAWLNADEDGGFFVAGVGLVDFGGDCA